MPKKSIPKIGKKKEKERKSTDEESVITKKKNKDASASPLKGGVKMTLSSIPLRQHREKRAGRPPGTKRLAVKELTGKFRSSYRRSLDPCDNSNDSGLGFDHHTDARHSMGIADRLCWPRSDSKRPRIDIKVENDEDNDSYSFPEAIMRSSKESPTSIHAASAQTLPSLGLSNNNQQHTTPPPRDIPRCLPMSIRNNTPNAQIPLTAQLTAASRFSDAILTIVKQPEQQHRARYQTEGSRGAVKDREGNGFPVVKLNGFHKPVTLQVFIGTDVGKVSPHMFYQACKVSGKNSTPCAEKKIDGTCVIELQLDPSKEMSATCDCVGILKERNVDVEHRFPDQLGNRSKKKSTRCRMIFRACVAHDDGRLETLQVCSQPIVCTQPPGVPEISKKSLTSCPASGGLELFVLGKNFSKDTKVYFQQVDEERLVNWEQCCVPDKEYLQQTHFVCVVPPYRSTSITEPVSVRFFVVASGKTSESHQFVYTPVNGAVPSASPPTGTIINQSQHQQPMPFFNKMLWSATSTISKREQDLSIMPPPDTSMVPLSSRRPSLSLSSHSPPLHPLKQEYIDENSQNSMMDASNDNNNINIPERYRHISESSMDVNHGDSNMSMINENSMDMVMQHHRINPDILHHDNSNMSTMSSVNENSSNHLEMMVRRNSIGCRTASMDMGGSNSNLNHVLNDDNSCGSVHSVVLGAGAAAAQILRHRKESDDLKVIDLRMKMPMGTVADLAGTGAPSMATLANLGVTEASVGPLPAQSAQSVESFLTRIESKTTSSAAALDNNSLSFKERLTAGSLMSTSSIPLVTQQQTSGEMMMPASGVFMAPHQQSFMHGNETVQSQNKLLTSSLASTFNTERLDAFINSTADHLISNAPTRSEPVKEISSLMATNENLLSTPPSMLVPSVISPHSLSPPTSSPVTLTQDAILSRTIIEDTLLPSSVSPALMLQSATNRNASLPGAALPTQLMDPEKAVLLEATVDLLQTQKKISEVLSPDNNKEPMLNNIYNNLMSSNAVGNSGNSSNVPVVSPGHSPTGKNDFIIPISVKEMQMANGSVSVSSSNVPTAEKKMEDRMIPQGFTNLTENELINLINPSCFDQV